MGEINKINSCMASSEVQEPIFKAVLNIHLSDALIHTTVILRLSDALIHTTVILRL